MTGYEIYQATSNGLLGVMFLLVSIANMQVLMTLLKRNHHSRLAIAMIVKYFSWVIAGVMLFLLQIYSTLFNVTGSTAFFTLETRNILRNIGAAAMLVVVISLFQMNRELRKAEREEEDDL